MMVDPMFMVIQSLRSFLTAVTSIAVTPTDVTTVGGNLTRFYMNLDNFC